ncbi:MAG: hypothetical protein J6C87_08270 [Bacteroides sp.]|nr:hypothetical protein [Bacteroides sp.]
MNKHFMRKEVLVSLLKLAANPLQELNQFRFATIKEMAEKAESVSFFMYLEKGMPAMSNHEIESLINDAIKTEESISTREKNGWSIEVQRISEQSELQSLIDFIKVCNDVQHEFIEDLHSLRYLLRPNVNEIEFLNSFLGLKGNDFGRCLQDWNIKGAIKCTCKGAELHRALSARLANVPTVQTLNKALRLEIPEKRNRF